MKALVATLVALSALSASSASIARADGFQCQTAAGDLNVKLYNHTQSSEGTRNGSIMVLSDPSVQFGRKTIASFTDVKGTLSNEGASYVATVDLRVSESNRSGENIAGTKLGQLKHIAANIYFSYARPVAEGAPLLGSISFEKRNGEISSLDLVCVRYLKD